MLEESAEGSSFSFQGPGLFEPIHGSAPDIAGQVMKLVFSEISVCSQSRAFLRYYYVVF
jgi:isocitrate dehydrogenase